MGKTFLVEFLLREQKRVIVIDSKGMITWKGYHLTENPVAALLLVRDGHKVIYRPRSGVPPESWWAEAVQVLHECGGGVIYIDELSYLVTPNKIDKGLADGFRLGGEIGVGFWYSAQESTSIHNTTLRQSGIIIVFYNQGHSDREKLAAAIGDMGHGTVDLDKYHFMVFVRGETYDHSAVPVYTMNAN
jgi:hypothetical protein